MRRVPSLERIIFLGGLVGAVAAGVIAYRIVGIYGDGPFASGFRRIRDPETGRSVLVHESKTSKGVVRRVIEGRQLTQVEVEMGGERARLHVRGQEVTRVDLDMDGDGKIDRWEYYDAAKQLVKVGFSLANDGVLDAWAYRDASGQLLKIEVSTRRDGTIDRWEYYEKGQLARVEEDADHDGRVDRWSTYDAGILIDTAVDLDRDGRPDPPPSPLPIPHRGP